MEQWMDMRGGGTLALVPDGLRVHLRALRQADGRGLYKVWLVGERGGRTLLGTLMPEGERLALRRTLFKHELERSGCWPVTGGEAVLAFAFNKETGWRREEHPERTLADPLLRRQLRGPALCQRGPDGFRLAVPFRTDAPVALESLLCLAQVELLEGRPHMVWSFDQEGRPVLPHKRAADGKD